MHDDVLFVMFVFLLVVVSSESLGRITLSFFTSDVKYTIRY